MLERKLKATVVFRHLEQSQKRIVVEQGGSRSSKTYNILIWLIQQAFRETGEVFTICRKTHPAVKATVFRDFVEILESIGKFDPDALNRSDLFYTLNGNLFEFISVDQQQKVRGRKRKYLFINEANELLYDDFVQLSLRTTGRIILDYNPSMMFHWIYTDVIPRPDCDFFQTTYKDNPFLEKAIVDEIERLRTKDATNWRIYGLGERGQHQGLIFTDWQQCDGMPEDYKSKAYGLDFGFSTDPTALIEMRLTSHGLYVSEVVYEHGLLNKQLSDLMQGAGITPQDKVTADSAEPKSIAELRSYGWRVFPSVKGPDSIRSGINLLKQQAIFVEANSLNLIKEMQNYKWKELKDTGTASQRFDTEPVDAFNHAIDAMRYGAQQLLTKREIYIA
jgi:phage terminase large subunit